MKNANDKHESKAQHQQKILINKYGKIITDQGTSTQEGIQITKHTFFASQKSELQPEPDPKKESMDVEEISIDENGKIIPKKDHQPGRGAKLHHHTFFGEQRDDLGEVEEIAIDENGKIIPKREHQPEQGVKMRQHTFYTSSRSHSTRQKHNSDTWYTRQPGRLALEKKALERFNNFRFIRIDGHQLAVRGTVDGNDKTYEVVIIFDDHHPQLEPRACILNLDQKTNPPHLYGTYKGYDQLCLQRDEWRATYTIAVVISWTVHWIQAYEHWKTTGQWLGAED